MRRLRHHGIVPGDTVDIPAPGLNYRLPDVLCALGLPQLERLESLLAARERVAAWYTERLSHLVGTPGVDEGDRHGWQAAVVTLDRRDEALAGLRAEGIEAQIGTYAVHRLSAYATAARSQGRTRRSSARSPCRSPTTTEDEVDRVAAAVGRFSRRGRERRSATRAARPRDRAYAELDADEREIVVATGSRYRHPDRLRVGDPLPALGAVALDDESLVGRRPRRATSRSCSSSAASPDRPFVAGPAASSSFPSLPGTGERRLRLHRRGARRRRVATAGEPRRRVLLRQRHARGAVRGGAAGRRAAPS